MGDTGGDLANSSQTLGLDKPLLRHFKVVERRCESLVAGCEVAPRSMKCCVRSGTSKKLSRVEGLRNVVICAELESLDLHLALRFRRNEHYGDLVQTFVGLDCFAEFDPGHLRHHDVADDEIRNESLKLVHCLSSVACSADSKILLKNE